MNSIHILLRPNVAIRTVGNKHFILNPHCDYSKDKIPEITGEGVDICRFVQKERSLQELLNHFDNISLNKIQNFVKYLKNNGFAYVWSTSHNKRFLSDIVSTEWSNDRTFYGCTFELTPKCNFRCIHCYLDDHHEEADLLSTEQVKSIIDKLYNSGLMMMFFSGGDPFVRKDFKEIYLYTRKKGILVELFTNGSLITPEWLEIFKDYPPIEVDISLYGSNEIMYKQVTLSQGMFEKVINNIKCMRSMGINVSLKCPVITTLKDDLPNMINLSKELDVPFRFDFIINPTIDNKSKNQYQVPFEEASALMERYSDGYQSVVNEFFLTKENKSKLDNRKYYCSTGRCSGFVDFKGRFCPCIEMREKGIDILNNDFDYIWEKAKSFSYEKIKDTSNYRCASCDKFALCKSCPAIRERIHGSPTIVTDSDCAYANALYNQIMKGGKEDVR